MSGTEFKRFVRFFYDPTPKNEGEPIWCLGREYAGSTIKQELRPDDIVEISSTADSQTTTSEVSTKSTSPGSEASAATKEADDISIIEKPNEKGGVAADGWPSDFLDDFESRLWITYRSGFVPIPRSQDPSANLTLSVKLRNFGEPQGFTSDSGWGCMIRSGQSLLANALTILHLGRDWKKGTDPEGESRILSMFADDPRAPFSIHRFVQHGASACGKHPGQWFGPSATASCIKELSNECASAGLNVYVTNDSSDVYEDRFRSIASHSHSPTPSSSPIKPTLILLGIRLGIERVTPVYLEALKSTLKYPQSIGIAGGRPSSSHYFVATQSSLLFYLDPHETKPHLPYLNPSSPSTSSTSYTPDEISTFHTRRLRALHLTEMDPSMLLGFLIRDEEDWLDWKKQLSQVQGKGIVHVLEKEPQPPGGDEEEMNAAAEDGVLSFDEDEEGADDATEVGD